MWYISVTPEFMVGDGKLLLRSGWVLFRFYLVLPGSCASSKYSFSYVSSYVVRCSSVSLTRGVGSLVFSLVFIYSYTSLKRAEFTLVDDVEIWIWMYQSLMYWCHCWIILLWSLFFNWFVGAIPLYPFSWWTRDHKISCF